MAVPQNHLSCGVKARESGPSVVQCQVWLLFRLISCCLHSGSSPTAPLLPPTSGSSPGTSLRLTSCCPPRAHSWSSFPLGLLYFLLPCLESLPASLSGGFFLIFKNFHLNITPLESSPSSEFPYVLVKMGPGYSAFVNKPQISVA